LVHGKDKHSSSRLKASSKVQKLNIFAHRDNFQLKKGIKKIISSWVHIPFVSI
jgi:hypothetical protein